MIEDETTNNHCFSKKNVWVNIYNHFCKIVFSHIATCILYFCPSWRQSLNSQIGKVWDSGRWKGLGFGGFQSFDDQKNLYLWYSKVSILVVWWFFSVTFSPKKTGSLWQTFWCMCTSFVGFFRIWSDDILIRFLDTPGMKSQNQYPYNVHVLPLMTFMNHFYSRWRFGFQDRVHVLKNTTTRWEGEKVMI